MSAVLSPSNTFSARLTLAAGVLVVIEAPSMSALGDIVGKLQAANDGAPATGKSTPAGKTAATAPGTPAASPTAAPSAPSAAGQAAGDAGNGAAGSGQAAAASPASSSTAAGSAEADHKAAFEVLKKAFLALSTNSNGGTDGRSKCQAVLASVTPAPAKLSEAKPEQYAALMAAIEKAAV